MKNKPSVILLIGPSAGGKSFFGKYFRQKFPEYKHIDDLPIVLDYLKQNNLVKIEDPAAWDEIIIRLAKQMTRGDFYIVEFARGHDPSYLKRFNIKEEDIYTRTIDLLLKAMHRDLANSVAIIHVTSSYECRLRRNNYRRDINDQDLPNEVLERVFKEDIFKVHYLSNTETKNLRHGYIKIGRRKIRVCTINNDSKYSTETASEYFAGLAVKIMDYFT